MSPAAEVALAEGLHGTVREPSVAATAAGRTRPAPRRRNVLPGFGLALGFTLVYLSLIVLIPLSAAFIKTAQMTWPAFVDAVSSPRVLAWRRCRASPRRC